MSLLRNCILPLTLGLILAPVAWAGDDDKKAADNKGDEQTIRGIISEVTVMGETDVDFNTRKAVTAEATYLTIIGHPWNQESTRREGAQASNDKNRDRDVNRTTNDSSRSGERPRHRMNVYVVAISPKTKVCECKESGKEGSASVKEEACGFDKLEIGDRVEVSFNSKATSNASDNKDARAYAQRHGRHRIFFGNATAVKILEEPMGSEHHASTEKK